MDGDADIHFNSNGEIFREKEIQRFRVAQIESEGTFVGMHSPLPKRI